MIADDLAEKAARHEYNATKLLTMVDPKQDTVSYMYSMAGLAQAHATLALSYRTAVLAELA